MRLVTPSSKVPSRLGSWGLPAFCCVDQSPIEDDNFVKLWKIPFAFLRDVSTMRVPKT